MPYFKLLSFCILAILLILPHHVRADVYSWEDKDGMHFVDDPGKVPAKYRNKNKSGVQADPDRSMLLSAENQYKTNWMKCFKDHENNIEALERCKLAVTSEFKAGLFRLPHNVVSNRKKELDAIPENQKWDAMGR